jgi:PAS domain S-box-containing protein
MDTSHLRRKIHALQQCLDELQQTPAIIREASPSVPMLVWDELAEGLDELRVAEEELLQQHAELLATRQEVEIQRERYRELFDCAPEAYVVTDLYGTIQEANRTAATRLHYAQDALKHYPLLVFIAPDDHLDFQNHLLRCQENPVAQTWEGTVQPRHGPPFPALFTSVAVDDRQGRPIGRRWLLRDLTEQNRLHEQLVQAQKIEAVGQLAGGVAHEFNNLLTIIIGRTQLLLSRLAPAEAWRQDIELIQCSASQGAALTQQLLTFSRKQPIHLRVVDLNAVVAEMSTLLQQLIGEHIHVATVLDPRLGRVRSDPGQLSQVLVNLALNARDAMPRGGHLTFETANVDVDGANHPASPGMPSGPYVRLAVRDTGCGMDATTQSHLFEPFFTTKEVGKGTGLGLAMVYGIIVQSGGHIEVDSVPWHGTVFTLFLPRLTATVEAEPLDQGTVGLPVGGSETVLLVEDDADIRALTQEILQMAGYHVLAAAHGHEALQLCATYKSPIHMLATDVMMPEMSGRDLANHLAHLRPATKVLYISGYPAEVLGQHGKLEEGIALLHKPFTPDVLLRTVRAVLDGDDRGRRDP